MIGAAIEAMERGLLPDVLTRAGIRHLCKSRLQSFHRLSAEEKQQEANLYIQDLLKSPVAECTDDANRQHYELPPAFFEMVLGKNLKYSSGFWPDGCTRRACNLADITDEDIGD